MFCDSSEWKWELYYTLISLVILQILLHIFEVKENLDGYVILVYYVP